MTLLLLLSACSLAPTPVNMHLLVGDAPPPDGVGLAGLEIQTFDRELNPVDTQVTDAQGEVDVLVIGGTTVFIQVDGEGRVPTGFAGTAAAEDFEVADGLIWSRSADEVAEIEAVFEGCPNLGTGSGLVEGMVRVWEPGYEVDSDWPIVTTGYVGAFDAEGEATLACYLDDEGEMLAPDATVTGQSGRFAIVGAPTGIVTLVVGYEIGGESYQEFVYTILVPESGVAPMYPAYVELPG